MQSILTKTHFYIWHNITLSASSSPESCQKEWINAAYESRLSVLGDLLLLFSRQKLHPSSCASHSSADILYPSFPFY